MTPKILNADPTYGYAYIIVVAVIYLACLIYDYTKK